MPRVQTEYEPGAEALRTTAAPNIQTVQARYDPNASKAYQLAEALGKAQPIVQQWSDDQERKKLQEQLLKTETYKNAFANSADGVSATQIGEKFPDTNPIVRARVAEGVGGEQGRQSVQAIIQEISQNDTLRLDNDARKAFIEKKKGELIAGLKGDDFYKSGAIASINRELGQYENTWTQQTAVYHQQVQTNDFTTKVGEALKAQDPVKALEALDDQWKATSSLNNIERNKAVVNTAIDVAFTANNGLGDPTLLDKIPTRFLNEDAKNKLVTAKRQIMERGITDFRNQQFIQQQQREENIRKGKIEMLNDAMGGKEIDPAKYRNDPELFAFALQTKDAPRLPETVSVGNAQKVRTAVLDGSTVAGMDANQIIDSVIKNPTMNPREKQDLVKEIPKLLEGRIAMDDPMVKNALGSYIEPALKQLESSTNFKIQGLVNGGNLRNQAMNIFEEGVRNHMYAWYQTHGSWPNGLDKQKIIDEERKKSLDYIQQAVKIGGGNSTASPAPAAAPAPAPKPQAPAPAAVPKVTSDAEYNALKPGTLFVGPDGVTRRKP